MHLLTQAKIKGELDPRIPNKDQLINLIDAVVLDDIHNWTNQLRESDYMSNNIKEGLIKAMDDSNMKWHRETVTKIQNQSSPELKAALSILSKTTEKKNRQK